VVGRRGEQLPVLSVWQSGPATDAPEQRALLVVDVAATPEQALGTYTLKVWDSGAQRTAAFADVRFPPAQAEPPAR
jgi:hypothetical protein